MKIVLSEEELLYKALKKGYVKERPYDTMTVLAKYYFSMGQSKKQVKTAIDNFMSKNYPDYIFTNWYKVLDRAVSRVHRKKDFDLTHIEKIKIYKEELKTIRKINNKKLEKLAFSLLVYAKIFNEIKRKNNNWVEADIKEILNDARITVSQENGALLVRELYKMGLVRPSRIVDSTDIKVLFAVSDGDVAFEMDDFRDIVFYYLKYIGENVENCEVCGRFILLTVYNRKYCRECWREKQLQWQRESMKNIRKK